jgi:hypothetical protein
MYEALESKLHSDGVERALMVVLALTKPDLVDTIVKPSGKARFEGEVDRGGVGMLKAKVENREATRRLLKYILGVANMLSGS